jgi:hypothetical protein
MVFSILLVQTLIGFHVPRIAQVAHADVALSSCFWTAKMDPSYLNFAFPDQNAIYYMGYYTAHEGDSLIITGEFPYARYMSFNVYDNATRSLDALTDYQIQPDPGSYNPYLPNANRRVFPRNYTIHVNFGAIPTHRAPNTIYTGTGQNGLPNYSGLLIYRIYIPDKGMGNTGGVPLPSVTIKTAGGKTIGLDNCGVPYPMIPDTVNSTLANTAYPLPVSASPGYSPPLWTKFFGIDQAIETTALENGLMGRNGENVANQLPRLTSGGFLQNLDNKYIFTPLNRSYGPIVVFHGKAPTFPNTLAGQRISNKDQVRYWSFCQNDITTERYVACLADYQMVTDKNGYYTLVISDPSNRPKNAYPKDGVNWLPWGVYPNTMLIYRQMLANKSFTQSIANIPEHASVLQTMREYYPVGRYCTKAEFEQNRCGF